MKSRLPMPRFFFGLAVVLIGLVTSGVGSWAKDSPAPKETKDAASPQQDKINKVFPALRLIPQGQSLKGVSLIQYEGRRKTGVLTAESMTVISDSVMAGKTVTVHLFDVQGREETVMKATEANLVDNSVLKTSKKTTIKDIRFETEGPALTFDSTTKVGWMSGPVQSRIHVKNFNKQK